MKGKERLFMTQNEQVEASARSRSDAENKERYKSRESFQNKVKEEIANTESTKITSGLLREWAQMLDKFEQEKEVIKNISQERASVDNENLAESMIQAEESRKNAERDAARVEEVRKRIQGLSKEDA